MNCEFPEVNPVLTMTEVSGRDRDARLRMDLSEGLHAMAQPLTVLQGALWTASMQDSHSAVQKPYLDMAVRQVSRLGDMLNTLRDVLATVPDAAQRSACNFSDLVSDVLDEMHGSLQSVGVRVAEPEEKFDAMVHADAERTRRALRAGLRAMISTAQRGDTLQLCLVRDRESVRLEVHGALQTAERQVKPDRLHLSVAEANMINQGGALLVAQAPLCVTFTLPVIHGTLTSHAHARECVGMV